MAFDKDLSPHKVSERELHDQVLSGAYENIRETHRFSRFYQNLWIKEMLDLLPGSPKKVLDYCCGTSILFPHILKRYKDAKYVGIDLSAGMLDVGQRRFSRYKNFRALQQDAENLRFKDASFDTVIARGALHHLPDPLKGVKEIHRVLKKDGILLISDPVSNTIVKMMRSLLYKLSSHFSKGHRSFTRAELKSLLKNGGFDVKKTRRFGLLAFPFGFPDIIPLFKFVPYPLLRILAAADNFLLKIPVINTFSWTLIVFAQKN